MLMPEDRGDVRTHSSPRVSGYSQEHSKRAKEHGGCLQTPFLRCNKETENNQRAGAAAPPQRPHGHTIADAWSRGRGVRSHNTSHEGGVYLYCEVILRGEMSLHTRGEC